MDKELDIDTIFKMIDEKYPIENEYEYDLIDIEKCSIGIINSSFKRWVQGLRIGAKFIFTKAVLIEKISQLERLKNNDEKIKMLNKAHKNMWSNFYFMEINMCENMQGNLNYKDCNCDNIKSECKDCNKECIDGYHIRNKEYRQRIRECIQYTPDELRDRLVPFALELAKDLEEKERDIEFLKFHSYGE